MRAVLLLLLFVVWETSADAPRPPVSAAHGAALLAVGYGILVGLLRLWGGRVAADETATYEQFGRRVDRFNRGLAMARAAVPAWFAVGVFALGWRHAVDDLLRRAMGPTATRLLATPGVIVGLLPGLVGWAGLWWSQYPVDRAVREQGALVQLESDLPVFAPPSLGSYMANRLRVQLLFTVVPVLLILAVRDVAAVGLRWGDRRPVPEWAESAVDAAAAGVVILLVPVVLRRVLSTHRLPDGRLRQRLDEVLRLAGVRCRDVLLWDTHHNLSNALVMGLVPRVRYVLFTDLLVQSMTDEHLQAVFAHELGHVRHRHLLWFVGVMGTAMAAMTTVSDRAVEALHLRTAGANVAAASGFLVAVVVAAWVGYATLSRWFERQADVYAVRLMDRAAAGAGTVAFAGALHRVAVVNNIPTGARNWTHGSIGARLTFIHQLAIDPAVGPAFDRAVRRVRLGLILLIVACVAVAVVGFRRV